MIFVSISTIVNLLSILSFISQIAAASPSVTSVLMITSIFAILVIPSVDLTRLLCSRAILSTTPVCICAPQTVS